jgi:hypothetical protein
MAGRQATRNTRAHKNNRSIFVSDMQFDDDGQVLEPSLLDDWEQRMITLFPEQ